MASIGAITTARAWAFYQRIDWRGDGPGYVESEYPIYPWAVAAHYRAFGIHEQLARVIPFVLSLVAMLAFFSLARRLLPRTGALAAAAFFVVSPLARYRMAADCSTAWLFDLGGKGSASSVTIAL